MSNKWKDRIIRGGFIAVGTVAAVGCVTGLIAVAVSFPCRPPGRERQSRRGCRHQRCLWHRRELPQPAADGQPETPPGLALSLKTPRDSMAEQGGEPKVRKTRAKHPRPRPRWRTGRPYRDGE